MTTTCRRLLLLSAGLLIMPFGAVQGQNQTPALVKYNGPVSAKTHESVKLTATALTNPAQKPVEAGEFTFTLGKQTCKAKTDAKGQAVCALTLDQPAGKYKLHVEFWSSNLYAGAGGAEADFTIEHGKSR